MANPIRSPISHLLITLALVTGVATYEGWEPSAMIPIKDDVPTLGYGTTVYPDGTKVKMGDTVTRAQASEYLQHDLDEFKIGMMKCVSAPLTKNEFNAYMSLMYNTGTTAFCNSSIPYKLNAGYYKEACLTLLHFNKVKDLSKPKVRNKVTGKMQYQYKVIRGLDNRRKAEYKTCISADNT